MSGEGGCFNCPIMCGAKRQNGEAGVCGVADVSYVARAARHFFEEPPISGTRGSGAIFFEGCNMACVFCQNFRISRLNQTVGTSRITPTGAAANADTLSDIMLRLQALNAHNINLVTPTPHIDLIIKALIKARSNGLCIPVVYNTNGYERVESLKRLDGLVDIYLPDYKYATERLGALYSGRGDYCNTILPALYEMARQTGICLTLDDDMIAKRGMIIRHLVLPAAVDETRRVLDSIKENFSTDACLSLMSQYTPIEGMKKPLDRRLTHGEYSRAVDYCLSLGFRNVYVQKRSSADGSFTPAFDGFIE